MSDVYAPPMTDLRGPKSRFIYSSLQLAVWTAFGYQTFQAPLKKSLVALTGQVATYSRSTPATFTDQDGMTRTAQVNQARMNGMRCVTNLVTNSQTIGGTGWTTHTVTAAQNAVADPFGGNTAATLTGTSSDSYVAGSWVAPTGAVLVFSVWLRVASGSTSVSLYLTGAGNGSSNPTLTTTWQRFSMSVTTTSAATQNYQIGGGSSFGNGVVIQAWGAQLENVSGQAIQTVGDYVPTGTGGPVFGPQLNQNPGPFTSNTGFQGSGSTVPTAVASGGNLVISYAAAVNYAMYGAYLPTVAGVTYTLSIGVVGTSYGGVITAYVATTVGGNNILNGQVLGSSGATSFQFTATTANTWVAVSNQTNSSAGTITLSSLSLAQSLYSGAGVDGVANFDTTLTGARVADPSPYNGMPCGYLNEPAATNLLLNSATPATQGVTTTAQQYTVSFWGTGTCVLSGTATGTLNGTGATARVQLTVTATAGTLTLTFSGSTSQGQVEAGASATSWISTAGLPITRTADSDTYPVTVSNTAGAVSFTIAASGAAGGSIYPGVCVRGADSTNCIGVIATPTLGGITLLTRSAGVAGSQPAIVPAPVKGTQYKVAISWNAGRVAACVNGGAVTVLTGQTMPVSLTTFATSIDYPWLGTVTNASTYSQPLPDATLQAITT